ncbi:hypothetical protein UlMin_013127 [Ulmus minor]
MVKRGLGYKLLITRLGGKEKQPTTLFVVPRKNHTPFYHHSCMCWWNATLLDPVSDTVYTVLDRDNNGVVDLQARTCSCKRFQLEQLPCVHAMIAIRYSKRYVYDFYSEYYNSSTWKATYAGVVYPLPHKGDWVVPNEVRDVKLLPSDIRSVSGRQRKSKIPSIGENAQRHKCSRCRQLGHHHKTCQNPIPLHERTFQFFSTSF